MFLDFFFELRRRKVPVSTTEWLTLLRALSLGLHDTSLDGFYHLSRALLVKQVAHYDAFDQAFVAIFGGVQQDALHIAEELLKWLEDPALRRQLTEEERRLLQELKPDELRKLFAQRLKEQKERHDRGNRWIGTGGTSPFGHGGTNPAGIAVGGGGARSAMQVAGERRYKAYRNDVTIDVRQIDVALKRLRDLGRQGAVDELDLDETIDQTAKNAGDLEVVLRPPQRNRTKLVLLMDVGGSMDPYAELCGRLFTAASRSGRFARFRAYYFHNCVYQNVYEDSQFRRPVPVADLVHKSDRTEKLVVVGDAAMHPAELFQAGAVWGPEGDTRKTGLEWMRLLSEHFRAHAWINPDPESYWSNTTVQALRKLFPMFPFTLDGVERAVRQLVRGGEQHLPEQGRDRS